MIIVRSQDKTILISAEELHINNNEDSKEIWSNMNGYGYNLGAYATPERAIEVLDEIHGNILCGDIIFEMPEK